MCWVRECLGCGGCMHVAARMHVAVRMRVAARMRVVCRAPDRRSKAPLPCIAHLTPLTPTTNPTRIPTQALSTAPQVSSAWSSPPPLWPYWPTRSQAGSTRRLTGMTRPQSRSTRMSSARPWLRRRRGRWQRRRRGGRCVDRGKGGVAQCVPVCCCHR